MTIPMMMNMVSVIAGNNKSSKTSSYPSPPASVAVALPSFLPSRGWPLSIMPIVRSKQSMGKLDEGGSLEECAGLFFSVERCVANMVRSMSHVWTEGMFAETGNASNMKVDLVTCGVWSPVATVLMAVPRIKMIFGLE